CLLNNSRISGRRMRSHSSTVFTRIPWPSFNGSGTFFFCACVIHGRTNTNTRDTIMMLFMMFLLICGPQDWLHAALASLKGPHAHRSSSLCAPPLQSNHVYLPAQVPIPEFLNRYMKAS